MDARPDPAVRTQGAFPEMRGVPAQPPVADRQVSDEIDLGQLFGLIWHGKLWIILGMGLGLAVAAFSFANTAPTFQADALVQLEEKSAAMMLPGSLSAMAEDDPRSVTEVEILRSRMVLGRAVADQNLDWVVRPDLAPVMGVVLSRYRLWGVQGLFPQRFARPGEGLALQNLVVPPEWLNRYLRLTVAEGGAYTVELPNGDMLTGQVGAPLGLEALGFTMLISDIRAAPGRVYNLRQIGEGEAIEDLRRRLTVSERGRGSGILELRVTGPDRAANARALDAILRAYQRQNINRSAAQAEGSLDFIREQIPMAEQALRQAEAALNAFQMQQVSVDLRLETQTILDEVTRVEAQLAELQRREDELSLRFTPMHPNYRLLLDERARLQTRLDGLREQIGDLPETQRQIINLQRDVDLAQRLYLELLTRAQEVEVMRASTIGSVRILDSAIAARDPIAPRRNLLLALGVVLGLMAAIGVVLLRSWLRKGIQDASELERMGLPVFATVNYNRAADTQGRRNGALPILALTSPTDLTIEALRSLRTSLHFGMLDAGTPTLTLTSTHPEAGKSFLSVNLAVVAAQAGQRVCLIDADLRRGQLRRYMNQPRNHPGLAEVLAGTRRPENVIQHGPVDDMYFIGTGRYPPNPSELLMRAELQDLFQWCSRHFDLVILDSPPALAVTDPVILGRNSGATILIARHDKTLPGEIEATLKIFQSSGQRLAGAVLNGFDPSKAKGGYSYGYGYGYRYSYQQRGD
jgi:tyrosine-protein kinase Etk/Wzc